MHAEGNFTGRITEAAHEQDSQNKGGLVLAFTVSLEDGEEVVCRHRTHGDYWELTKNLLEKLGLDWPKGILRIAEAIGKEVPVRIKNKDSNGKTYQNCYISFATPNQPATEKQAARVVALLAGEDPGPEDEVPF